MRFALALMILTFVPCHSSAQQDLKCDVKKQDFMACAERQDKTYLGKYICILDQVAGIQYDDDKTVRPYVGRIKPTEDRFFMEIREDDSLECAYVFPAPITKECKTKYKMEVKSKNLFLRENGYSALLPQRFITTGGQMTIVAGGRFAGNYRFGWDNYVFEGRCEKLN
jgi:hypothetical protein